MCVREYHTEDVVCYGISHRRYWLRGVWEGFLEEETSLKALKEKRDGGEKYIPDRGNSVKVVVSLGRRNSLEWDGGLGWCRCVGDEAGCASSAPNPASDGLDTLRPV